MLKSHTKFYHEFYGLTSRNSRKSDGINFTSSLSVTLTTSPFFAALASFLISLFQCSINWSWRDNSIYANKYGEPSNILQIIHNFVCCLTLPEVGLERGNAIIVM